MRRSGLLALVLALALAAGCSSSGGGAGSSPAVAASTPPPGATDTPAPAGPPPASPAPPGSTPPVTSVRVHYAGHPGTLSLRGAAAPLSWATSVALTPAGAGLYTWSSADVAADTEIKPLLDATWSRGPNYRVKPGQTLDIYPRFVESHGTVDKRYPAFVSKKLPSTRGLWIYLPPTYVENTEARFGVLYMHDAQNLFSSATAYGGNEWQVDETLDAGAEDGTIRETIVVGIENTAARIDELTPTVDATYGGGKADSYLAMLTDEIKPKIDLELRTLPGRADTAVMGSSLGGLVSAYAGVTRADVFGLVGEMSPSTWWDNKMILAGVSTMAGKPARPARVYVDSGDSGASNDDVLDTTELAARYRAVGYTDKELLHVVQPGAIHSEIYWAQRLPAALRFLLGPRPN